MNSHLHTVMIAATKVIFFFLCISILPCYAVKIQHGYCQAKDYDVTEDMFDFCLVAKCLDKTGGGYHSFSDGLIWEGGISGVGQVKQFGDIKNLRTDRPYSRGYLDCRKTKGWGSQISEKDKKKLDIFYKGITKIWECLKNDDAACLARYTDEVHLRTPDYLSSCRDLATYDPGIPGGPNFGYHIVPHLIFDNPLNFYKCIIENKSAVDRYDQTKRDDFEITDYHFLKRFLRSPNMFMLSDGNTIRDGKIYFEIYDIFSREGEGNYSLILRYDPSQTDPELKINLNYENPPVANLYDFYVPHKCKGCGKGDYDDYQIYLRDKSLKDQFYDPKYPDCHLGSFAPLTTQKKCHVSYCFDHTGGGYDVFDPSTPSAVLSFEKPYSKKYMTCTYPRENAYDDFTKEMRTLLYRDLEKLWECYKKNDLTCVAKMTYFKSNCGDDKWRIHTPIYPEECKGLGKSYTEVIVKPGELPRVVNAHMTLTAEEYYQCLLRMNLRREIGFNVDDVFKFIRSPYIEENVMKKDPSGKGEHEVEFILSTNGRFNDGIHLRYGTPANPKGFAISKIGTENMIGKAEDVLEVERKQDEAREKK